MIALDNIALCFAAVPHGLQWSDQAAVQATADSAGHQSQHQEICGASWSSKYTKVWCLYRGIQHVVFVIVTYPSFEYSNLIEATIYLARWLTMMKCCRCTRTTGSAFVSCTCVVLCCITLVSTNPTPSLQITCCPETLRLVPVYVHVRMNHQLPAIRCVFHKCIQIMCFLPFKSLSSLWCLSIDLLHHVRSVT